MKRIDVVIEEVPPEDGGGYRATIPAWGRLTYVGAGETIDEALGNLVAVIRALREEERME